jgi:hypothetical protein
MVNNWRLHETEQTVDSDRNGWVNAVRQGNSGPVYVMGKVQGKEFGEEARENPVLGATYFNNPQYVYDMGLAHAVDMFLGNGDRFALMNTGNWMNTVQGNIMLIDNFDRFGTQRLGRGLYEQWVEQNLPDLRDPQGAAERAYEAAVQGAATTRQFGAKLLPSEMEHSIIKDVFVPNFARGFKVGRKRIVDKLAPMLGKRSRTFKSTLTQNDPDGAAKWAEIKRRARKVRSVM